MRHQQTLARLRQGAIVTAAVLAVAACQDTEAPSLLEPADFLSGDATISLNVSDFSAAIGSRVSVAIDADGDVALGGLEGYLRYDASRLRFAGQIPEDGTPVVVNDLHTNRGELRFVSVNPAGYDGNVARFAFDVLGSGYDRGLRVDPEIVASLDRSAVRFVASREVGLDMDLRSGPEGRFMTIQDWGTFLDPMAVERRGPMLASNETDVYGDSNNDASISVFDVLTTAQLNAGLIECITGQTQGLADCTTANVEPINDGIGGACAPGIDTCGSSNRSINVFDVLAVAQDNANNPNHPVAGEPIPRPAPIGVGDTVSINDLFAGAPGGGLAVTLTGTVTLTAGTLWTLERQIRVGDEAGAAGELVVEPGVRIEGRDSTSILITRNGRIDAQGTPDNPIVFTCFDDASTPGSAPGFRAPACWGGVYVAGNARLVEGNTTTSPVIPGRNGGGALSRTAEGFDPANVAYGGDNDADNSGTIRYAIFAWGGFEVTTANELNNLTIGGCGSGTTLEYIQVHGGSDDGIEFFGGRCGVRYLYATENDDDGDDYSFGYDGPQQFVILQSALSTRFLGTSDKMFEVDNTETAATYGTFGPGNVPGRTYANVWNYTIVQGDDSATPGGTTFNYRNGAGSTLGNGIVIGAATTFDVDKNESCSLVSGGANRFPVEQPELELRWTTTLLVRTGAMSLTSSDCSGADLAAFTASITDSIAAGSVIAGTGPGTGSISVRDWTGQLRSPFDRDFPDFRPALGGVGVAGQPVPAGFTTATYVGALPTGGAIPWYLGWAKGNSQLR